MTTAMTTVTDPEIEAYVAQVRAALAHLVDRGDDVLADLLEDLPDHLAEIRGEEGGASLRERLGDPADYAAELCTAAGLAPAAGDRAAARRLAAGYVRFRERLERADRALGALLGYRRAADLARALRPGWWVLRGWIVALMLTGAFLHAHWTGFVPRVDHSWPLGALLATACAVASAAIGSRTAHGGAQTRLLAALVSVTIAVFGVFIARNVVGADYQKYGPTYGGSSNEMVQPASSAPTSQPPQPTSTP